MPTVEPGSGVDADCARASMTCVNRKRPGPHATSVSERLKEIAYCTERDRLTKLPGLSTMP